jgi:hypothetical protein
MVYVRRQRTGSEEVATRSASPIHNTYPQYISNQCQPTFETNNSPWMCIREYYTPSCEIRKTTTPPDRESAKPPELKYDLIS